MRILITGGAGYIGSHTCLSLLRNNADVFVVDNFSNASPEIFDQVDALSGKTCGFVSCDLLDAASLDNALASYQPDAVIHMAGLKAVGESVLEPVNYYDTNFTGTLNLLRAMEKANCKKIVYSSSASVYGNSSVGPVLENHLCNPFSPYGKSKNFTEELLKDWSAVDETRAVAILRYFNPGGADASGLIGERTDQVPNNLLPYIGRVAMGSQPYLGIFGNDYDTEDGTAIRDYIHVCDLADAHYSSINYLNDNAGCEIFNIGTGAGASVLEMLKSYEKAIGRELKFKYKPRRKGDIAKLIADPSKAEKMLNWSAKFGIDEICKSDFAWQMTSKNASI